MRATSQRAVWVVLLIGLSWTGCNGTVDPPGGDDITPDAAIGEHADGGGGAAGDAAPGEADAAPPESASIEVAPYFYTWSWNGGAYAFGSLVEMRAVGGPDAVTLAFVNSDGGCSATRDIHDHLGDVQAYVAAGGHVKASFGGAGGLYLEGVCGDADALAAAIGQFVDETGITDLDFDVEEGGSSSNPEINERRALALKQVQQQKGIRVAFTLPVAPDGLDDLGIAIVQSALDAGVEISFVNVMTMDYGGGIGDVGDTAIASSEATAQQLTELMPGLSLEDAYRKVGATAMIGTNDDGNVFSVSDAQDLAGWAAEKHLGLLSYWSIQRDQPCPDGADLGACSEVNSANFEFLHALAAAAAGP